MRPWRLRGAWFSRLLRHPARRRSGSILSIGTTRGTEPTYSRLLRPDDFCRNGFSNPLVVALMLLSSVLASFSRTLHFIEGSIFLLRESSFLDRSCREVSCKLTLVYDRSVCPPKNKKNVVDQWFLTWGPGTPWGSQTPILGVPNANLEYQQLFPNIFAPHSLRAFVYTLRTLSYLASHSSSVFSSFLFSLVYLFGRAATNVVVDHSVCQSATLLRCAKTATRIDVLFGTGSPKDPGHIVFDGVPDSPMATGFNAAFEKLLWLLVV